MSEQEYTPEEALRKATDLGYDADRYAQDDPKWKSPEEFLDFGERLNPILRENNKRLEAQLKARDEQIARIQVEVTKFAKVHEETAKAAYAKALVELKAEKAQALEQGNYEEVVEIDEKIADTRAAEKAPQVQQQKVNEVPTEIQETYQAWEKENKWLSDAELNAYAKAEGEILVAGGFDATGNNFKPFLDKVAERVKERHPEKFENDNRRNASMVDGGGDGVSSGGAAKKHTYASLPKEAKEACDFLISTGTFKSKEDYLKNYQW